jgi:hypothetical protein
MALLEQESDDETFDTNGDGSEVGEAVPTSAGDPVAVAAAASVLYSLYEYYVNGNKDRGIFAGLWAPTLLSAANYFQHKHLIQKVRRALSSF